MRGATSHVQSARSFSELTLGTIHVASLVPCSVSHFCSGSKPTTPWYKCQQETLRRMRRIGCIEAVTLEQPAIHRLSSGRNSSRPFDPQNTLVPLPAHRVSSYDSTISKARTLSSWSGPQTKLCRCGFLGVASCVLSLKL